MLCSAKLCNFNGLLLYFLAILSFAFVLISVSCLENGLRNWVGSSGGKHSFKQHK